jgi:hypothetical protein
MTPYVDATRTQVPQRDLVRGRLIVPNLYHTLYSTLSTFVKTCRWPIARTETCRLHKYKPPPF